MVLQRPTHSVKSGTLTLSLEPTLGHSSTKQPHGAELVFSGQSKSVNSEPVDHCLTPWYSKYLQEVLLSEILPLGICAKEII